MPRLDQVGSQFFTPVHIRADKPRAIHALAPSHPQFVQNTEALGANSPDLRNLRNGCALQILDGEKSCVSQGARRSKG